MPEPLDTKGESLRRQGVLNPRPQKVTDPLFRRQRVLRPTRPRAGQVRDASPRSGRRLTYHRSRPQRSGFPAPCSIRPRSLYHGAGLPGLIPQRPGPRHAHKLSDTIIDFLLQQQLRDPTLRAPALVELLRTQFELAVHPRSIERALERRRKKVQ